MHSTRHPERSTRGRETETRIAWPRRAESKFCAIKRGTRGMEQNHKRSRQAARSGIYNMMRYNFPNESNIPTTSPRDPARQASRFRQAESSASLRMTRGGMRYHLPNGSIIPLKKYIKILRSSLRCKAKQLCLATRLFAAHFVRLQKASTGEP